MTGLDRIHGERCTQAIGRLARLAHEKVVQRSRHVQILLLDIGVNLRVPGRRQALDLSSLTRLPVAAGLTTTT